MSDMHHVTSQSKKMPVLRPLGQFMGYDANFGRTVGDRVNQICSRTGRRDRFACPSAGVKKSINGQGP